MKFKPKFFRVAKEGETIDGRKLTRKQIEQMGSNYDPKEKHGARIWIEHFRSLLPKGMFPAQGDVTKTYSKEGQDGKLGLWAELLPLPSLIEMNATGQKVYTSIEMEPDYCGTGEAYMTGLACTDNPASAGTTMLSFSAKTDEFKDKMFSAYLEQEEFSFDEQTPEDEKPKFFDKIKSIFNIQKENTDERFSDHEQAMTLIAEKLDEQKNEYSALSKKLETIGADSSGDRSIITQEEFNTLKEELKTAQSEIEKFAAQEPGERRRKADGAEKTKPRF